MMTSLACASTVAGDDCWGAGVEAAGAASIWAFSVPTRASRASTRASSFLTLSSNCITRCSNCLLCSESGVLVDGCWLMGNAGLRVVGGTRILIRLRFMARHMICVSSRPEAPTMPPTATRKMSLMAIPAMEPATPERELSREMVMGMSAPPTRTEKNSPKSDALTSVHTRQTVGWPLVKVPTRMRHTVRTRKSMVSTEWLLHTIGFCGSTRCSLPAATRLPTSVIIPTATARSDVKLTNG